MITINPTEKQVLLIDEALIYFNQTNHLTFTLKELITYLIKNFSKEQLYAKKINNIKNNIEW